MTLRPNGASRSVPAVYRLCFDRHQLFGMVLMAAILFAYYGTFYPTTPSAALEHTGMYDYVNESPSVLKRDVSHEMMYLDDDNYYDESDAPIEEGRKEILRRAINTLESFKPSTTPAASPTLDPRLQSVTKSQNVSASPKGKPGFTMTSTTTTSTTPDPNVFDPDVRHSNAFLDAVFANADRANMTQPLGLCRKNAEFKMADYKAPLFPADSASDILQCINDLLKSQTKHQLCVHLDPETNAYLKWLVLTGEPKEKHRPVKIGLNDDFLFPSTPCASDSPQQTPECLVARGLPEDIHF